MRVFITGASGFIGSAVIPELIRAGHQVLGLARSEAAAGVLTQAGAQVHRGSLEDLESLRRGAAEAEAVIHAGFIHDFTKFAENCAVDRRAIEALGDALVGSNRPFLVTSGVGFNPSRLRVESDPPMPIVAHLPRASEQAAETVQGRGVRTMVVRLPQVHDPVKQGLVTYLVDLARAKGVSAYVGDGSNRWAAAHVLDVGNLYKRVLEQGTSGARYHAIGEEGVALRDIAEAIGRGLNIPVVSKSGDEAAEHFGWLRPLAGIDMPGSSAWTQEQLGWKPTGPSMITDLRAMRY